ncbi:MAG TPA: ATP phosphoribosyltransferase regulatory subunit [Rhizomicrobium sp.]|jgi:ATP phosphoribosyltransferase regulatory subunit|nr:ATP phosphoribosyltransferase regulatory subunit [Rhizomicrobium sp.]
MAAFPYYGAGAIEALGSQASALLDLFGSYGYVREEPAVLQPAEIFLNRYGEEIRRRTFTLTDPSGHDLALRPDLTIPICREAVLSNRSFPARICYNGLVFRHQPGEPHRPTQFFQAGAELLGLEDCAAGDKEILTLSVEALRVCGLKDFSLRIGDLSLFGALVDALALPPQWRSRLKRHFWRPGYVESLLYWLSHGDGTVKLPGTRAEIEALLDAKGEAPLAGRTREEIIARALGRAAEAASLHLEGKIAGAVTELLDISGPAEEALGKVRALLKTVAINLDSQLAAMEARLAVLRSLGVDPARVAFTAHFGRNMEYYTGFVFELWARDKEGPVQVAGGGRYDTMMEMLGAKQRVSAVGCAIRTERALAAKAAGDA